MMTIASEWNRFVKSVFAGQKLSIEVSVLMRRCFYAGAWCVLGRTIELGEEDVSEEDGVAELESLRQELQSERWREVVPQLMKDMTEPELSFHLRHQLNFIKECQTPDTVGSMLIIFQDDGITQYGATIDPSCAPTALRELADRLEQRDTVERDG